MKRKKKNPDYLRNMINVEQESVQNILRTIKRESKPFEKEQSIKCPQKSSNAFYKCSTKFYEGSKLQKLLGEVSKCSDKKCFSQHKALNKFRNQMYI